MSFYRVVDVLTGDVVIVLARDEADAEAVGTLRFGPGRKLVEPADSISKVRAA
jgi:hypothetical protein